MTDTFVRRNRTLAKLKADDVAVGAFLRYPDAGFAELLATTGLDFLVFDGEHGVLDVQSCEHMTRAAELHGVTPLVRVDTNHPGTILRYMDAGTMGCHIPGIETAEDAKRAVSAVKFGPEGTRGLSASRASGYGPTDGYPSFVSRMNNSTQVVAHIETRAGVEAAADIAEVAGIDVLLLGSLDLSQDLQIPGQVNHPEVLLAARTILDAADANGKAFGAVASGPEDAARWLDLGATYLIFAVEAFLRPTIDTCLRAVRGDR